MIARVAAVAAALSFCRRHARRRADLPGPDDHHDRAARARRLDRHPRPHMAKAMSADIGPDLIVENVSGAAGTIPASPAPARSAPDGYTVAVGDVGHQRRRRRHL